RPAAREEPAGDPPRRARGARVTCRLFVLREAPQPATAAGGRGRRRGRGRGRGRWSIIPTGGAPRRSSDAWYSRIGVGQPTSSGTPPLVPRAWAWSRGCTDWGHGSLPTRTPTIVPGRSGRFGVRPATRHAPHHPLARRAGRPARIPASVCRTGRFPGSRLGGRLAAKANQDRGSGR